MFKYLVCVLVLALAGAARADERRFDFSETPTNQLPAGARNLVAGEGKPGDWRVILDDVPDDSARSATNLPLMTKKSVVAQLARDMTDEHFPLLVLGDEVYGDFTFKTRFKIVAGVTEEMAGVAFRIQDEKNFYVVRASALGSTLYFYKFVHGVRSTNPIGENIEIEKGVWHELSVQYEGGAIRVMLDGRPAITGLRDTTFPPGKVGFWTKSDSVSYFTDARITFTPREAFAQKLVDDALEEYPRVLGLKIYAPAGTNTSIVASGDPKDIGRPGVASDADCIKSGINYYLREDDKVTVTVPLRDRNGDPVAAVRVELKPIRGQTQENALNRAMPIIQTMQARMAGGAKLTD